MLESLPEDQSLWNMTQRVTRIPDQNPPLQVPGDLVYSDSEKAEALADNLDSQFQLVPAPVMQMDKAERVRDTMGSFALTLASELLLTNPKATAEIKVGKAQILTAEEQNCCFRYLVATN